MYLLQKQYKNKVINGYSQGNLITLKQDYSACKKFEYGHLG